MPRIRLVVVVIATISLPLCANAQPPEPVRTAESTGSLKLSPHARILKGVSKPPSEHIDDPQLPGPTQATASPSSTTSTFTFNGHTSVQVNVNAQGNNIFLDAANEPSIAINPANPKQIAIAWRQFNSVNNNFRQAGRAYSADGGLTWTFPGVLDPGIFRSDPVLGFDAAGNFYYCSLTVPLGGGFRADVFKSSDGGVTWSLPVNAFGGDKQWLVVDDRVSGTGAGNVYQTWTLTATCCAGDDFTRSINGADSFQSPIPLPEPHMMWGTLDTDSNGVLYLGGATLDQSGHVFYRSLDARNSAVAPTFEGPIFVDLGGFTGAFAGSDGPNPDGLLGQVWIAAHPGKPGHIYMLGSVIRPDDPSDVMFVRSIDGGQTWSPPRRVNDDPEDNFAYQWFGTLSVAPNGRLDVIWNDTRVNGNPLVSAVFYSYSLDEGQTWSPNEQVSPIFNSHTGFPNQNKIGDYYHMISDDGGANLAYAATFNGEEDVYFLRIRQDCNHNGIDDDCDTACGIQGSRCDVVGCGLSPDCDHNHIPDECEPNDDCNHNGTRDICEIEANPSLDCNLNHILDTCEGGDCNANQIPDVCDVFAHGECNGNGIPDECDIASGHSLDRNHNGVPDECEGACCDCFGCLARTELDCILNNGNFGGFGTQCGDPNSCQSPSAPNDLCTQAEEVPSAPQISELFDNRCALSSGLEPPFEPCESGDQPIAADLWYQYIAPCTGTLEINTCDQTNFDAIMAVYSSSAACVCPTNDSTFLQCQDDSCGVGGGPPFIDLPVSAGQCYTIRLGGWNGSTGNGEIAFHYLTPCNPTDLNGDSVTNLKDFAQFENCFGPIHIGCAGADFNHDGVVDLRDYRAMYVMFGL